MPLSALALVVLAGFIHASWNIAAKKAGGDVRFVAFTSLVLALFWAPLGLWLGVDQVPSWGWREWGLVGASAVLHVVYFITLLRGYRQADLTVVYPVARGSGPLLSSMLAITWLGEAFSALSLLGMAGVIAGVFLIAGGPALWRAAHDPAQRARVHQGLYWGGLTGVLIASYTVVDAYAVKWVLMSPILIDYFGNLLRLLIIGPVLLRERPAVAQLWRVQWRYACVVGVLSPISYVLVPMPCRSHRCRMWRRRARCPCCLRRCWVATCSVSVTAGRASQALPALPRA
jgi:drug/metabolite transporter (DMT)-like permease